MIDNFHDCVQFNRVFDVQPIWRDSGSINPKLVEMHGKIMLEEFKDELLPAINAFQANPTLENLTELFDALIDVDYFLRSFAAALDLPWQAGWIDVHNSNMRKVHPDGSVKRREDGKVLKPDGWKGPDLFSILMAWQERRVMQSQVELQEQYQITRVRQEIRNETNP